MSTTALVVPTGPYFGFTLAQLETELSRLISDRQALSVRLQSSSINAQSFQFADIAAQRAELDRRGADLQAALYYMDPGRFPLQAPTNAAVAAFI